MYSVLKSSHQPSSTESTLFSLKQFFVVLAQCLLLLQNKSSVSSCLKYGGQLKKTPVFVIFLKLQCI